MFISRTLQFKDCIVEIFVDFSVFATKYLFPLINCCCELILFTKSLPPLWWDPLLLGRQAHDFGTDIFSVLESLFACDQLVYTVDHQLYKRQLGFAQPKIRKRFYIVADTGARVLVLVSIFTLFKSLCSHWRVLFDSIDVPVDVGNVKDASGLRTVDATDSSLLKTELLQQVVKFAVLRQVR